MTILKEFLESGLGLSWLEKEEFLKIFSYGLLLFGITLAIAAPVVIYLAVSRPLARAERARLFLDLLAQGLEQGKTVEATLSDLARCPDPILGKSYAKLDALLRSGWTLPEALKQLPNLLPAPMVGLLQVGSHAQDLRAALPACYRMLGDGRSQTLGASNALPLLHSFFLPVIPFLFLVLQSMVVPKYLEILRTLGVGKGGVVFPLKQATTLGGWLAVAHLAFLALFYGFVVSYVAGPWLCRWIQPSAFPLFDWIAWQIPWRRKRILRNFCSNLSLLLDAGCSEAEALKVAGSGSANLVFARRVERLVERLAQGERLTEVLQHLDHSGEFHWRLANAITSAGRGFRGALEGWLEQLDSKAFQQEQTMAQILTSFCVVFHGVTVGLVAIGMFQGLVLIIESEALW